MPPPVDFADLAGKSEYQPKIKLKGPRVREFATACCSFINHGPFAERLQEDLQLYQRTAT
jgi:hypothetical protein